MRKVVLLAPLVALAVACRGSEQSKTAGDYGGTVVISVPTDADVLLPPLTLNPTSTQVGSVLFDRLAEVGDSLNTVGDAGFRPQLAQRWTWAPDSLSIAFSLDPRARWHDGQRVTAEDVRFTFRLNTDSAVGSFIAPLLASIDSVSVRDSLTPVFWFKKRTPEQFFDAAFQMRILPAHLLRGVRPAELRTSEFARHPVGSGPFRLARWTQSSTIELVADTTHYRGRPHLDRLIWSVAPDPNATALRLFSGEADFLEYLRPQDVAQLPRHPQLKAVRYGSLQQIYLLFNERDPTNWTRPHPIFGDREVRRAITMAVDRKRLVANVLDSLGVVSPGPFPRAHWTADTTIPQIPYDPDSAKKILDRLGWRVSGPEGYRVKNGVPLRFSIAAPNSSSSRVRMAVLMQEMLKQVGVRADLEQMEFVSLGERLRSKKFDAVLTGLGLDPSPSTIRQNWASSSVSPTSEDNPGSYANPRFDALIDSAVVQMDPAKAKRLYRRAYEVIITDAPAIWLYEPVLYAGVQKRVHPQRLRADGWWAGLAEWYIPANERTARDNIGLRAER
jgi:peptide/nickel transport system substrate-binding protein